MKDGAHDQEHIYRVLYYALDISQFHKVDIDVVITSALLYDIGREEQFKSKNLDHAIVGGEKAYPCLKIRALEKRYLQKYKIDLNNNGKITNEVGIKVFMKNERLK